MSDVKYPAINATGTCDECGRPNNEHCTECDEHPMTAGGGCWCTHADEVAEAESVTAVIAPRDPFRCGDVGDADFLAAASANVETEKARVERLAVEMVERARTGFVNVEDLLIKSAYRIATTVEVDRWEYNADNVTPMFAARFLVRKGITFSQVCRMNS